MELQDHFPQSYKGFHRRKSDNACIISLDNWQEALRIMKKENLKNLELNPIFLKPKPDTNFSFLKEFSFIERLNIIVNNLNPTFEFEFFPNLRELFFEETTVPIRFDFFPHIKKCGLSWNSNGAKSIYSSVGVEVLYLEKYDEFDLISLATLNNLKEFRISFSKNLISLNGIQSITQLKTLWIANCTNLKDLNNLSTLTELEKLLIEDCKNISSIEPISEINNLRKLFYLRNGSIETIQPLFTLKNLEQINLFGTEILDGKLNVLEFLQKNYRLKSVNFKNKKGYTHTREQLGFQAFKLT